MKNFDRIARYLAGEMSPEERAAFEEEISAGRALRQEVETQRLEEELLDIAAEERIRRELEAVEAPVVSMESRRGPGRRSFRPFLAAAAGILLLIVAAAAFFYLGQGPPAGEVADRQFEANPPDFASFRAGGAAGFADPLGKYEDWIKSGDPALIEKAADTLSMASENDPSYPRILFMLGYAYLQLGQFQDAAAKFAALAQNQRANAHNRQQGEYYQLLSLMKAGEKRAVFQLLIDSIKARPDHAFFSNMQDIEQELR